MPERENVAGSIHVPVVDEAALIACPFACSKRPHTFRTAGPYRRPDLRRCRCLAVKLDQHIALPSRASVRTQRAMKSADRRGAI